MRYLRLDKRFKLYKSGQCHMCAILTPGEFIKAQSVMTKAFGMGQQFRRGSQRSVPNRQDWFYIGSSLEHPSYRIYFRRKEQVTFLQLAMS